MNTSLVTSKPPISQMYPQISTRNPWSSVVLSERNATALTQETRSFRNPENFFSGLQKFVKWTTDSAFARRMSLGEGTNDLKPVVSSRDRIVLIVLSMFPVFVALTKLYFKSSENLRFLNKRVIIKRIEKKSKLFATTFTTFYSLGVLFSYFH